MMTLQDNINHQNIKLWEELSSQYNFKLVYSKKEISWRVNSEKNPIEIYTNSQIPDIPSFTHELLHVYIESKGMSSVRDLLNSIYGTESFNILTTNALFTHIHNFCCHTKMFPYFIEMGLAEDKFLAGKIKLGKFNYLILRIMFSFKRISPLAVTDFIGYSMSLFNDNETINRINTMKSLNKLKRLNPSLFEIVEDFNVRWKNSENLNLALYFKDFDFNLNEWLIKNKIL
jgi:hypothetical protein